MSKHIKSEEPDNVRKVLNDFRQLVQTPGSSCEPVAKPKAEQTASKKSKPPSNEDLMAENKVLRRLLWICHAQGHGYGDDGEMQFDGIDFKRMSAQEIQTSITHHLHRAVNVYMTTPGAIL